MVWYRNMSSFDVSEYVSCIFINNENTRSGRELNIYQAPSVAYVARRRKVGAHTFIPKSESKKKKGHTGV